MNTLEEKTGDAAEAKELAIKEFLSFHLDYNTEELNEMVIKDTKAAANEDVLYFALENQEQIREIYYRKAACVNDDLLIREYIPPQYYKCWMAIQQKATERRAHDKTLKTQLRWGERDIEIYTKTKGSQEPFRRNDLKEFMGMDPLPAFGHNCTVEIKEAD